MTNFDKLRLLSEALYGPLWQRSTAKSLNINARAVHRWAAGESSPNDGHISDLMKIAEAKADCIKMAIKTVVSASRADDPPSEPNPAYFAAVARGTCRIFR